MPRLRPVSVRPAREDFTGNGAPGHAADRQREAEVAEQLAAIRAKVHGEPVTEAVLEAARCDGCGYVLARCDCEARFGQKRRRP